MTAGAVGLVLFLMTIVTTAAAAGTWPSYVNIKRNNAAMRIMTLFSTKTD